ncbi:MAG: tripartite tricarboxylate transporter substrate binding protein, partial [Rubrivivax sp.]
MWRSDRFPHPRHLRLARVACAFALGALIAPAALSCGAGPVRIVVPVTAGGPMDRLARALAEQLSRSSGVAHLVENRSGGMTIPAWDAVAKAAP